MTSQDAAHAAAIEAQQLVDALKSRVASGDETVTAGDIASAQGLADFAKLREKATRHKAAMAKYGTRYDGMVAQYEALNAQLRPNNRMSEEDISAHAIADLEHNARGQLLVDLHEQSIYWKVGGPIYNN